MVQRAGFRVAAVWLLLALSTAAQGATIEIVPLGSAEMGIVTVTGPFELSDIESFKNKTALLSNAIVSFSSSGGNLVAGIEIGTSIRLRNFSTLVPNGARCASACALAWLGGTKRLMGPSAQVGFHSASVPPGASGPPAGDIGNALMGAYLNRIGLPDRAVIYITKAAPEAITWLSLADAAQQGIDVALFTPAPAPSASTPQLQTAPPQVASVAQPLTPDEATLAHRLARNYIARSQKGAAALRDSIDACYAQTRAAQSEASAKYCIALDILVGRLSPERGPALIASVQQRAADIMTALNAQARLDEAISRSILIAGLARDEVGRLSTNPLSPGAAAVAPPAIVTPMSLAQPTLSATQENLVVRNPRSVYCSKAADEKGLHGIERKEFRAQCKAAN
jgi:hypothetical protein